MVKIVREIGETRSRYVNFGLCEEVQTPLAEVFLCCIMYQPNDLTRRINDDKTGADIDEALWLEKIICIELTCIQVVLFIVVILDGKTMSKFIDR